jgi:CDP-diglyceride synthetase
LVLDIFQGVGIAIAVGIRPFLPALAVGALAAGDVQIDFTGTDLSFLQSAPFLLGVLIAAVAALLIERRLGPRAIERGPLLVVIGVLALALGALLFAGALAQDHYATWPGVIGGIVCAALGALATRPLFARVRARLERDGASAAVPVYAEGAALAVAALSVLAPPFGLVVLLLLGWLLLADRRRDPQKYAGLRILR